MGFFKLAGMTFRGLFKKADTLKYPYQKKKPYNCQKGSIVNSKTDDCTLCGICQKKCPSNALKVNRDKKTWSINYLLCIQCSYCLDSCPKKCLTMTKNRPNISVNKDIKSIKIETSNQKDKK